MLSELSEKDMLASISADTLCWIKMLTSVKRTAAKPRWNAPSEEEHNKLQASSTGLTRVIGVGTTQKRRRTPCNKKEKSQKLPAASAYCSDGKNLGRCQDSGTNRILPDARAQTVGPRAERPCPEQRHCRGLSRLPSSS